MDLVGRMPSALGWAGGALRRRVDGRYRDVGADIAGAGSPHRKALASERAMTASSTADSA